MEKFSVDIQVYESGKKKPEYTLESDLEGELTLKELLEFTKSSLIVISDVVLKEEQSEGFDNQPVVAVDGKVGKPVSSVNPLGQIEFTARADMKNILLDAYEALLFRSRVLTGRYKSSHFVFLNGTQVATDLSSLTAWLATEPQFKDKDLVRIVNIQPYARKLERFGITAQKKNNIRVEKGRKKGSNPGKLLQVPNGTYHLTVRAIRSKYKRNSSIRFAFLSGGQLGISGVFKTSGRRGRGSVGRPYLYPTILIAVNEKGIT